MDGKLQSTPQAKGSPENQARQHPKSPDDPPPQTPESPEYSPPRTPEPTERTEAGDRDTPARSPDTTTITGALPSVEQPGGVVGNGNEQPTPLNAEDAASPLGLIAQPVPVGIVANPLPNGTDASVKLQMPVSGPTSFNPLPLLPPPLTHPGKAHGGTCQRTPRIRYPQHITNQLDIMFNKNNYPTKCQYDTIAMIVGLDVTKVKVWFQNRRSRNRRNEKRRLRKEGLTPEQVTKRMKLDYPRGKAVAKAMELDEIPAMLPANAEIHFPKAQSVAVNSIAPVPFNFKFQDTERQPSESFTQPTSKQMADFAKPFQLQPTPFPFLPPPPPQPPPPLQLPVPPPFPSGKTTFQNQYENFQGSLKFKEFDFGPKQQRTRTLKGNPYPKGRYAQENVIRFGTPNQRQPLQFSNKRAMNFARPPPSPYRMPLDGLRFPYQTLPAATPPQWHRMRLASPQELGFGQMAPTLASTRPYLLPYINDPLMQMYAYGDTHLMQGNKPEEGTNESAAGVAGNSRSGTHYNPQQTTVAWYPQANNVDKQPLNLSMHTQQFEPVTPPSNSTQQTNAFKNTAPYSKPVTVSKPPPMSDKNTVDQVVGNVLRQLIFSKQMAATDVNTPQAPFDSKFINPLSSAFSHAVPSSIPGKATQKLATQSHPVYFPRLPATDQNNNTDGRVLYSSLFAAPRWHSSCASSNAQPYPKAQSCPPNVGSLPVSNTAPLWPGYSRQLTDSVLYDSGYTSLMAPQVPQSRCDTPYVMSADCTRNWSMNQPQQSHGMTSYMGSSNNPAIWTGIQPCITKQAQTVSATANESHPLQPIDPNLVYSPRAMHTPAKSSTIAENQFIAKTEAIEIDEPSSEEEEEEEGEEEENEATETHEEITIESSSCEALETAGNWQPNRGMNVETRPMITEKYINERISPILSGRTAASSPVGVVGAQAMGPLLTSTPEHERINPLSKGVTPNSGIQVALAFTEPSMGACSNNTDAPTFSYVRDAEEDHTEQQDGDEFEWTGGQVVGDKKLWLVQSCADGKGVCTEIEQQTGEMGGLIPNSNLAGGQSDEEGLLSAPGMTKMTTKNLDHCGDAQSMHVGLQNLSMQDAWSHAEISKHTENANRQKTTYCFSDGWKVGQAIKEGMSVPGAQEGWVPNEGAHMAMGQIQPGFEAYPNVNTMKHGWAPTQEYTNVWPQFPDTKQNKMWPQNDIGIQQVENQENGPEETVRNPWSSAQRDNVLKTHQEWEESQTIKLIKAPSEWGPSQNSAPGFTHLSEIGFQNWAPSQVNVAGLPQPAGSEIESEWGSSQNTAMEVASVNAETRYQPADCPKMSTSKLSSQTAENDMQKLCGPTQMVEPRVSATAAETDIQNKWGAPLESMTGIPLQAAVLETQEKWGPSQTTVNTIKAQATEESGQKWGSFQMSSYPQAVVVYDHKNWGQSQINKVDLSSQTTGAENNEKKEACWSYMVKHEPIDSESEETGDDTEPSS